jgi:hypothetical protein
LGAVIPHRCLSENRHRAGVAGRMAMYAPAARAVLAFGVRLAEQPPWQTAEAVRIHGVGHHWTQGAWIVSDRFGGSMAGVVLFHHAPFCLMPGIVVFANELRRTGHTVHTPDLFEGPPPVTTACSTPADLLSSG